MALDLIPGVRRIATVTPAREWARCEASPVYFLEQYGWVFNVNEEAWVQFDLWPAQRWALMQIHRQRLTVVLKARQLGQTWLMLGYALWLMLFHAAAAIGIFSRIEDDAKELLDFRLKGMYRRLPPWMQAASVTTDNRSRWELSNGSLALAFATTGGRGYTFSLALVDEADHQPDLPALMVAAKPTVDAGGRMVLLSSPDKSQPASRFKAIYRAAKQGANDWHPIFLPWWARPDRTQAWYAAQVRDAMANTGSLDDLHQEYPATDTEALSPRTLDKRIPAPWIEACYQEQAGIDVQSAPSIPGLTVYRGPEQGREFVLGLDPAEGNPTSDDSALIVIDLWSGEECAILAGKYQPSTFAAHADAIATWYNRAALMVERNNHGHAVLLWLADHSNLSTLTGHDGRVGWNSNSQGKALLYNGLADGFRQRETVLHSFMAYQQIASIEGSTLRAPDGAHDDIADAYALAWAARHYGRSNDRRAILEAFGWTA